MFDYLKFHFASETFWDKEFIKLVKQEKPGINLLKKIRNSPLNENEYSCPHLKGKNSGYRKFIILSKQRSGSTYLSNLLQHHQNIACYGELFLPHQCFFNYPSFPREDNAELLHLRNSNIKKFLHCFIFRNYLDTISAVGFKIFYNQSTPMRFPGLWKILKDYPELHIIQLIRKNHLRSYISFMQALATDVWYKKTVYLNSDNANARYDFFATNKDHDLPKDTTILSLNFDEVRHYFQKTDEEIKRFADYFSGHPFLKVYYEDFKFDPTNTMKEISAFLGVYKKELSSPFVRQHPQKISELVSNYFVLKERFSKTKWAVFFED